MCSFVIGAAVPLFPATPRFYAIGQVGQYNATIGSQALFGPYVDQPIKSGTRTCFDLGAGAALTDWFSFEVGYLDCASFTTGVFPLRPGVMTSIIDMTRAHTHLRAYRLTPVFSYHLTDSFCVNALGGLTHSVGTMRSFGTSNAEMDLHNDSYHAGLGVAYAAGPRAAIEGRFVYYDFGELGRSGYRVNARTLSVSFSWRF
jgi:hypothetical protein